MMLRKMYVVVGSCFEQDGNTFTWLVGVYSKQHVALEVAKNATSICEELINNYGPMIIELIDGKVQEEMLERLGPVTEENVASEEYIETYLQLRREFVGHYNPYDPDMHIDTDYWQPSIYSVQELEVDRVPILPEATTEELKQDEGESEDDVATQERIRQSKGESDT